MRPVIGISTYREQAQWGVWDQSADLLPSDYARIVEEAGGWPVLLPPLAELDEALTGAREVVDRLDGLIIAGGADVDPARYGDSPHEKTKVWREDRDAWEFALLTAAAERQLPVLGICRGMQVMAAHGGGSLHQHHPEVVGNDRHNPPGDGFGAITVSVADGSRLASLVGDVLTVNCHHHQAVHDHPGFAAVAHADDGSLEAMEAEGSRFCVGVQWHPETAGDAGLVAGLVDAARSTRSPRGSRE